MALAATRAAARPKAPNARPSAGRTTASSAARPSLGRIRLNTLPWTTLLASLRSAASTAPSMAACRSCGHVNPANEIYCQGCARRLAGQTVCAHCGHGIPVNARFCPKCGRPV